MSESVPVKKRHAFDPVTNTNGQPAEPRPKRPARKRERSQKDADEAAALEAAPPKEEETKRPREPAAAPQKPAAKSKAVRKAKPPARKKTVAKLAPKAKAKPATSPKPETTPTEDAPQMKKQTAQAFFRKKNREAATKAVAADSETANFAGRDKDKVITMSAQAITKKLAEMWHALSDAAKQKWKDDAPLVKARGKRKEVPPPDDETKAKYEAFKAKHPKSKDAKDIKAFQRRDPASFSSFFTTVRCSFSGTVARGGALLRSRESGVATRGRRRLRRDATT